VKANPASSQPNSAGTDDLGAAFGARWLWAAPVLVALLLSPTLLYPFARDQAVFTYVGKVIAEGGMPYRDAWDLKPPGIYLAYAALWRLSGGDAFTIMAVTRVADVLIACLTGVQLALLGSRLGSRWTGIAAAGWYAALYLQETYWGMAQAESWANPLILLAVLALWNSEASTRIAHTALAGVALGIAACVKPTALLSVVPFLFAIAAPGGRIASGRRLLILLAMCGAMSVGLVVLWLKAGGAWEAFVDIQQGFVAPYSRLHAPDVWKRIQNVFGYTLGWSRDHWAPVALAIAGGVWSRKGPTRSLRHHVAAALGFAWLGVCIQNKYFGYHWQPVLPFLALLAAVGTGAVFERLYPLVDRRWAVITPLAWALTVAGGEFTAAAGRFVGAVPAVEWNSRFGPPGKGDYSFEADRQVAEWLKEHSNPEDRVLVWGFEPAIYLLADRRCPTRFFFNVPVAVDFTPQSWRDELLRTLKANPPEWLIVVRNDPIPWANGRTDNSESQLNDWPEVNRFVEEHYAAETQIEDFRIMRKTRLALTRPGRGRSTNP
jgi:hypothetical protein